MPKPPYYSARLRENRDLSAPFYGMWSPQVMRGLQDKLGMHLGHLASIQKALIGADVLVHGSLSDESLTPELTFILRPVLLKHLLGRTLLVSTDFLRPYFDLVVYPIPQIPAAWPTLKNGSYELFSYSEEVKPDSVPGPSEIREHFEDVREEDMAESIALEFDQVAVYNEDILGGSQSWPILKNDSHELFSYFEEANPDSLAGPAKTREHHEDVRGQDIAESIALEFDQVGVHSEDLVERSSHNGHAADEAWDLAAGIEDSSGVSGTLNIQNEGKKNMGQIGMQESAESQQIIACDASTSGVQEMVLGQSNDPLSNLRKSKIGDLLVSIMKNYADEVDGKKLKFLLFGLQAGQLEVIAHVGNENDELIRNRKQGNGRTVLLQLMDVMRRFCAESASMRDAVRRWGKFVAIELLECGKKLSRIVRAVCRTYGSEQRLGVSLAFSPQKVLAGRLTMAACRQNGLILPFLTLSLCKDADTRTADINAIFKMGKDCGNKNMPQSLTSHCVKPATLLGVGPGKKRWMTDLPYMPSISENSRNQDVACVIEEIFSEYEDLLDPSDLVKKKFTLVRSPDHLTIEITMHSGPQSISKTGVGRVLLLQLVDAMRNVIALGPHYEQLVRRWARAVSSQLLGCSGKKASNVIAGLRELFTGSDKNNRFDPERKSWYDRNVPKIMSDVTNNPMLAPFLCLSFCKNSNVSMEDYDYVLGSSASTNTKCGPLKRQANNALVSVPIATVVTDEVRRSFPPVSYPPVQKKLKISLLPRS